MYKTEAYQQTVVQWVYLVNGEIEANDNLLPADRHNNVILLLACPFCTASSS
jgi:hypothetical protein